MNWLHFIGRSFYTETKFIKEAQQHGVTRRIARSVLKRMNFGDVVWLAINDGKSSVMLGKFVVTALSGIVPSTWSKLADEYRAVMVDSGGAHVQRGCGSYNTGPAFALIDNAGRQPTMAELASDIEGTDSKPMVAGRLILTERVRLKSMRQHMGFRPFDADAYIAAVANAKPAKVKSVKGFFYVGKDHEPSNVISLDEHRVQVVTDYRGKGK